MKTIPLNNGMAALVDDEDYEWLSSFTWYARRANKSTELYYAMTTLNERPSRMHRMILGLTSQSQLTDHRNGNGLDNQRHNLRIATRLTNQWNQPPKKGRQFKGVFQNCSGFFARIRWHKQPIYLGQYHTAQEAAAAYNEAATELFGEFARLNQL